MIRMSPVTSRLSLPGPPEGGGGRWYFSRKEIEENSPSRRDGLNLKKENYLRKTYCTFLRDLGKKLKVPQLTIATAMIFCHRFYLRQSHAKNDRITIATACMFLAGKVEETPRPLKDVILVSFEIINKNDQAAVHKIKQKEVYEQRKELILLAERVVLATLGFDMNVLHPYKPLVNAIRKYKVDQKELVKVAWNFVNDGLWTSLCLQFKPHHIAAAAIFLAAKFLKVKLPSDGEKVWWQEFDITPRQLEEVSNQILELYEQNRVPASQAIEADGGIVGGAADNFASEVLTEDQIVHANTSLAGGLSKSGAFEPPSTHLGPESVVCLPKSARNCSSDYISAMTDTPNKEHEECKVSGPSPHHEDVEDYHHITGGSDWGDINDDKQRGYNRSHKYSIQGKESAAMKSTPEVLKKFDEDKLKQLQEKRKKSRGDAVRRTDMMDEFDPIVKELEEGVELAAVAAEGDKSKHQFGTKGQLHEELDMGNVEEGELTASENSNGGNRQSPTDQQKKLEKQWHDYPEDSRNRLSRHGHTDRDKEQVQENHV